LPTLLTYFRKGKLDKFYVSAEKGIARELDFLTAVKVLKPVDETEARTAIPEQFYALLGFNKSAFLEATAARRVRGHRFPQAAVTTATS